MVVRHFVHGQNVPNYLKKKVNGRMMDRFQKKRSQFLFFFDPNNLHLLAVYEMVKKGNMFQLRTMWINDNVPFRRSLKTSYEKYTKRILQQSHPDATIVF